MSNAVTSPEASVDTPGDVVEVPAAASEPAAELEEELLIEEISIDGMCGVY